MAAPLIHRILRVDHAGEHGAVSIYRAQLARARRSHADLVPWLEETLAHEERHRAKFRAVMDERKIRPCGALRLWSVGGAVLGTLTSAFGRGGIYVCTSAVERTVRRHLVAQGAFLERTDPALAKLVSEILAEEDEHLAYANEHHDMHSWSARCLGAVVVAATELLILASTQAGSLRLESDIGRGNLTAR